MDALALAGRGALVFGHATRPGATTVAFHDSPDATSDPTRSGCWVVSIRFMPVFDDELSGAVSRSTAKVADQFGVEP